MMIPVLNPEGWLGFKHMKGRNTSIIDQEGGMYKGLTAKERGHDPLLETGR